MMEVYAGYVEHADYHFGRILTTHEAIGELDNTVILVVSDNGASSEGGPQGAFNEMSFFNFIRESADEILPHIDELGGTRSYNHYAWGWAWAGDTPFRRWKKEVYRGGCTDNLVVHWPAGFHARGELRTQYALAIDVAPTILEALELEPPRAIRGVAQSPLEGVSFAHVRRRARTHPPSHPVFRDVWQSRNRSRWLARGLWLARSELFRRRRPSSATG
jgi:arylsulfatase